MLIFQFLSQFTSMLVMVISKSSGSGMMLNHDVYYQMIGVGYTLFFGGLLKIFFTKRNLLLLMLGIETMMLGLVVISLSCFSNICMLDPFNYLVVFNLLTVVISESVIGLILILLLSKSFGSIDLYKLNKLKG